MLSLKDIYSKENQRICFDLDNTLVSFPKVVGDYSTVEPIQSNINALKFLYNMGHYIIIYTARRMRTHNGDITKVKSDIEEVTKEKLKEFEIPYHELIFGKPYAQYYIDDLAINPHEVDISTSLGLNTIKPRKFNNIVFDGDKVIKSAIGSSASKSLCGEKYWYETIPDEISDLFPEYISSSGDTIKLEKVDGVTFTSLLLGDSLTVNFFHTLLDSIERIHNSKDSDLVSSRAKSLIYYNYKDKVVDRFIDYDYSRFEDSTTIFRNIMSKVKLYEENDLGRGCIIHGDPVFSNILLTSNSTLKLIDMRGEIGGYETKYGDIFYDYAKIYQSLTGYDYILVEDRVAISPLKEVFEKYFISKFGFELLEYLKYLTASLYFSLIPLHDNSKCDKFYQCIFDLIEV